jgi:hypothetical protein
MANRIVAQMLFLEAEDPEEDDLPVINLRVALWLQGLVSTTR